MSIIATLPVLSSQRFLLVSIATIPAMAACWSRYRAGAFVLWPVLAGLVWGLVMVWSHEPIIPNLPTEMVRQKMVIHGVVADRQDRSDSTLLILDEVESDVWRASGQVRITLFKKKTTVLPGDRVEIPVRLRPLGGMRNPGGFDYRTYLLEMGVIATGSANGPVVFLNRTQTWFWNRLRQEIADWIGRTLPESQRGLAEALLVGKRGHLDGNLQNALFVSGTFHLVAISGLHISLVAGGVFFLLRLALTLIIPLSRRWDMKRPAALLSLFPVLAYAQLAGWSVSTQRAFIMVGLFLLAVAVQRKRHSWRILTLAAIAVLSWQPSQLMSAGFQLSFLCVVVILYLLDHLPAKKWWEKWIWSGAVTVALALVTAPVVQYAFHRFSPYGMIINPVAIPWVGEVSTPLGLMAMVLYPLWHTGGEWLLRGMGWSLELYRWLVEWSLHWPGAWSRGPGPSLPGLAIYLAMGSVALSLRYRGRWQWRRLFYGLIAVCGLWWPRAVTPDSMLRLIVLDVGQAMSMVLKMPGGGWSVVDSGGAVTPRFDIGEGATSSVLWYYGVERLERVVISHPQKDHMSGVAQLLRNFPVGSLWLNRLSTKDADLTIVRELMAEAERLKVPVRYFDRAEEIHEGGGVIRVLPSLPIKNEAKLNDRSLVLEIEYGSHRFLLTGDMESKEENWLLSQKVLHPMTVVLAPHHGSLTSSTRPFVEAVQPGHVVFSVGAENQWGFPKPEVVHRWQETGARLWRTDQEGAIRFVSDGEHLEVITGEGEDL
ncbi:MAG: DNA internalization-related competence protein ComEC/Rec2 [Magnetococcales bacterium]|nr:DNA internalization-related competence protein ComEC/Rec2 [Magnetococcales bacterium]